MFATNFKHFSFRTTETITIEAIKRQYHKLAMRWHPDRDGGDLKTMQEINAEFDELRKRYYNVHEGKNGSTYTDENQTTTTDVDDRFVEIIDQLIKMDGVGIEICGSFIWLSGNTYTHKADIKALGFRWASKKKMWFLAPQGWKKRGRRELGMDEIRGTYGSVKVAAGQYQRKALVA
jgi:curved DNA-binding protein CbpA